MFPAMFPAINKMMENCAVSLIWREQKGVRRFWTVVVDSVVYAMEAGQTAIEAVFPPPPTKVSH